MPLSPTRCFQGEQTRGFEGDERVPVEGEEFTSADKGADLRDVHVGSDLTIAKAAFAGFANFSDAEIERNLMAYAVQFANGRMSADFSHIRIANGGYFRKAIFAGPVTLTHATIGILVVDGDDAQIILPSLNLSSVEIQRSLYIANATIGQLVARSLKSNRT